MTTRVEQLAEFAAAARWADVSEPAREQLKLRVLDSIGCAIGALGADVPAIVRTHVESFGGERLCALIGGGRSAPDRAALYNGTLVRYLDFNDSFVAPGETCHPSDNLAPVLAAAEFGAGGDDLLTALAVAYQVQCRLSAVAPVRAKGFDHTVQGEYAVAAGVARALGLDARRTANAIAIAGTALNALRVTRTGELSHWKGLAYPFMASGAVNAAFLAMRGVTGPREVFEGNKGFVEAIAGPFEIDWSRENLESVRATIVKRHNAEIHSQSAVEALLELRAEHGLSARDVERIELDTFQVAYDIIGGGEEGDKERVRTKEEADHSLPYLLAVALLDGQVMPEQYRTERVGRADVQDLVRRVHVRPDRALSARFGAEHPVRLRLYLRDGTTLAREQSDWEGFHTRPMGWEPLVAKFDRLAERVDPDLRAQIVEAVRNLDELPVSELTRLLADATTSDASAALPAALHP
jgi:2-methylcitrate dehydratase